MFLLHAATHLPKHTSSFSSTFWKEKVDVSVAGDRAATVREEGALQNRARN